MRKVFGPGPGNRFFLRADGALEKMSKGEAAHMLEALRAAQQEVRDRQERRALQEQVQQALQHTALVNRHESAHKAQQALFATHTALQQVWARQEALRQKLQEVR